MELPSPTNMQAALEGHSSSVFSAQQSTAFSYPNFENLVQDPDAKEVAKLFTLIAFIKFGRKENLLLLLLLLLVSCPKQNQIKRAKHMTIAAHLQGFSPNKHARPSKAITSPKNYHIKSNPIKHKSPKYNNNLQHH